MKTYKGYIVKSAPRSPSLLSVATEGRGGKIPDVLSGFFTSYGEVFDTIDHYLSKQPKKRVKDDGGETNTESGTQ